MRLLFFIMLLVNASVFAYLTYQEQRVNLPKSVLPALHAERILVVKTESTRREVTADQLSCWDWSGFTPETLTQARAALDNLSLAEKLTQVASDEYWVYMAPLKNKRDAEKKLAELKALAIEGGELVDERGKWQYAISFAAFTSEDAAIVRLNQLKEKGVKSAKILKREGAGGGFLIQQADGKIVADLNKLQESFADTSLKSVECKKP